MKKVLFLAAAMTMAFAMSANAKIFEENHFTVNANVGSVGGTGGFGIGAGFQTELFTNDWITLDWDVLHFEWDAPFNSPGDFDQLSFKTGCRAYSPTFANDHLLVYSNLDMGYVLGIAKVGGETSTNSAFGLTWGAGLQLNKKWSLGYTLQWESAGKSKNHFGTVAFTF